MKRRNLLAALAVGVAVLTGPATASAGTLDQQQLVNNIQFAINTGSSFAQTFTAGLTGSVDQVDLLLAKNGTPTAPLTVEIRNSLAGAPGSTVLAAASVPPSAVGTSRSFVTVLFNSPAPVSAGSQYAIALYSTTSVSNAYLWFGASPGVYPGGALYYQGLTPPTGTWTPVTGDDLAFKTYVVPTAPPALVPTAPTATCSGKNATIIGTEGVDTLSGTPAADVIAGLGGNDKISGLSGKDTICGGSGNDKLTGGGGNDKLLGQAGKDTLKGGPGKDKLKGGPGKDKQIQ